MELDINLQSELISAISAFTAGKSWYESPAIIALVSGFLAIMGGVISNWANLRSEDQRNKAELEKVAIEFEIRKKEKVYDCQLKALTELSIINHGLTPTAWPSREYDAHEASEEIVFGMSGLIDQLDTFLKKYSYALPESVLDKIRGVIFECNENHWGASTAETPDYRPSKREIQAAESIVENLSQIIKYFKKMLGVENP
ncbi:hypothetical protein [Ectothiorhodospira lacustris]|uniref:hypothetical protein n=1 Tax=Ectothiorhodospira lacustris TaxID=2899127 RepID=UPI001EE79941|nr:hypothetical protein [Ectothiorhodospira lacustris]MCG5501875.1 hypothetical protein [Ectothiorhodospira lacustris]